MKIQRALLQCLRSLKKNRTPSPFRYKDLPPEIRIMILKTGHVLHTACRPENSFSRLPNLLCALVTDRELFDEAMDIFRQISITVVLGGSWIEGPRSLERLNWSSELDLSKLRYLTLHMSDLGIAINGLHSHPLLDAAPWMVNLEIVSLVCEWPDSGWVSPATTHADVVYFLGRIADFTGILYIELCVKEWNLAQCPAHVNASVERRHRLQQELLISRRRKLYQPVLKVIRYKRKQTSYQVTYGAR